MLIVPGVEGVAPVAPPRAVRVGEQPVPPRRVGIPAWPTGWGARRPRRCSSMAWPLCRWHTPH